MASAGNAYPFSHSRRISNLPSIIDPGEALNAALCGGAEVVSCLATTRTGCRSQPGFQAR
jgi:hypothetical protein